MTSAYYIGLMAGTSLDGVDAALIEINADQKITLKCFVSVPLPSQLKTSLQALNLSPEIPLKSFCEFQYQVAQVFIKSTQTLLSQAQLKPCDIQAIGSHGQTIFHDPSIHMSIQIGHPAFISKQTGITTVGDFRIGDMALGGQGAPLAPAFHQALFQTEHAIALANIGGIANISLIPGRHQNNTIKGFDTGPGNGLMDEWCQRHFNQSYDKNGDLAAQGQVIEPLLTQLKQDAYFQQLAPKSTGRDYFNQDWLNVYLTDFQQAKPLDILATLNQLTADTLAQAILDYEDFKHPFKQLTLCGGGAHNLTLIKNLASKLPNIKVQTTQNIGIDPNAIEAMMCAWLAHERLQHHPIALKEITGASKNAVLGGVWSAE